MDDARSRWNARHAREVAPRPPAPFLVDRAPLLPDHGRALDVAGGTGRHALWLAARGLDVTLVDVSDEACHVASERAAAAGLSLEVVRADVEREGLPTGPWNLILMHRYLDRPALAAAPRQLAPNGLLMLCQPTVRNLERHAAPSRRWLLEEGELAGLVEAMTAVEIIELAEGWTEEGGHEAHLVLRAVHHG